MDINYAAAQHNDLANTYRRNGDIDKAMQHIREALRLKPNYSAAFNNLGCILYSQGSIEAAKNNFQKALRITPMFVDAHLNLANCYASKNQMQSAATHYQAVLQQDPEHQVANFNLGMAYVSEQEHNKVITQFSKVIALESGNIEANYQLGIAYLSLSNSIEAEKYLRIAIELDPTRSEAYHNLAILALKNEQRELALEYFCKTLELNPDNTTAIHMQNALTQQQGVDTTPTKYIQDLFDQYADHYDTHVKEKLAYNVPYLLRQAVGSVLQNNNNYKLMKILDLGCGTGLCSIYFCDLAEYIVGTDLASNMLAHAKQRGGYDALCMYDINQAIPAQGSKSQGLIIAADVLVYCGDLNNIFYNCTQTLQTNGLFAFTIETVESEQDDFQLLTTGRFGHSINYIQKLTNKYNFSIELQQDIVPRHNNGTAIVGCLFVLKLI